MRKILLFTQLSFLLALLTTSAACAGASPTPSALPADPAEVMRRVFVTGRGADAQTVRDIAAAGRIEFVPVLIELLRFREGRDVGVGAALQKLTGQNFGEDWSDWVEWLGKQNIPTPKGFDAWKGELLAGIDENFRDFIHYDVTTRINLAEVAWGGVQKDGIPALVNPKFIAARDATYLEDNDLVFGLVINGDERAYPHRILDWHEMANDVVGGVPIALTY